MFELHIYEGVYLKQDILEVLIYLFENYRLEGLMDICEQDEAQSLSSQTSHSIRFFTNEEHQRLGLAGQSLLLRLGNVGVLDQYSREMVIDRVMALDVAQLHLDHIRWVILMVLSNRPGYREITEWAEVVISESVLPVIH